MFTNSQNWTKALIGTIFVLVLPVAIINVAILTTCYKALDGSAKSLLAGKKVIFLDLNDAGSLLPRHILNNLLKAPKIAAIGSSRVLNLHKSIVAPEQSDYLVNCCIAADLTNLEGIVNAYLLGAKSLPTHVVLGVDPWLFNGNYKTSFPIFSSLGNMPWLTNEACRQLVSWPIFFSQEVDFVKIFSFEFTSKNFKKLLSPQDLFKIFESTPERKDKAYFDSDGSRFSHQIEAENISYLVQFIYKMYFQNFMKLENQLRLERLVLFLKAHDVNIAFYLAPFHPEFISNLRNKKKHALLVACENFAKKIAKKYSIPLVGSYFPEAYQLRHDDFIDALHVTDKATEKIWQIDRQNVQF